MSTLVPLGNLVKLYAVSLAIDVTSKSANTTGEQDVTINGVNFGDIVVSVNKPSHSAGLGIVNARVKAANTVSITYGNYTASPIDPASETYTLIIARPEPLGSVYNV